MARYEDTLVLKDKVSRALLKMTANFSKFDKAIGKSIDGLEKLKKRGENLRKVGQNLQDFGNKLTVGLTLPIIGAATYAAKMGIEFQDAEMRLQTLLGSATKGTEMFNKIIEMGAKTPFEARDLLNATNTMLGFGISQEKVLPLMMQLGDISAGNAERFQQLALAFSQVSAAGKLQGQDLLQMINAGFNPLEQIAKRTGKTVGYWKDQMSEGKVTVAMVEQAMKDATSEGGRFNNMMEKMSQTASGKLSTMIDNFNMAMANLGKTILPYVTKGIEALTALFEKFAALTPKQQKSVIVIGAILALIGPLISGIGSLIVVIGSLPAAIGAVNTALAFLNANPIVLTITGWTLAIGALAAGIYLLWKNWDKVWNGIKNTTLNVINFITNAINTLIQKLGFISYLIPGLREFVSVGSLAGGVAGSINQNSVRQSSVRTTNNNSTTNNNFYGNLVMPNANSVDRLLAAGALTP